MPLMPPSTPLTILTLQQRPQDVTQMPPPISTLTTPYASTTPPTTILTLPLLPQDKPPTPAPHLWAHTSLHLCTPTSYHPYASILVP
ncbi:hypothetical protein O181_094244 [Austropuccinia psidii MF-1]|uniref:Uncharacterized protein n=1 Tax=Austropuccinia psidii MF-1 TaxID=1389203 RepID=A0A9Q3J312_9BASI|nr:hypothetical protein [Austropuccinia psidii MF-1]